MPKPLLTTEEKNLMSQLLSDAGYCEDIANKNMLLKQLELPTSFLPNDLTLYNNETFAQTLVYKLDAVENRSALIKLTELIEDKLPNEKYNINKLRKALVSQNIHIITGTKGGIGKTLTGLAVACNYFFNYTLTQKQLLAVDLNTTNPDLFRILSFYHDQKLGNLPDPDGTRSWYTVSLNNAIYATRPSDPHHIRGGAASFWDDILRVATRYENRKDMDILVDTSQHAANLVFGRKDISEPLRNHDQMPRDLAMQWEDIIWELLKETGRIIYIWVFWTWANFQDSEIDNITTPLTRFNNTFGDRINIVHVLNPSALMLPQIKFAPTKGVYRELIEKLDGDIATLQMQIKRGELDLNLADKLIKNRKSERDDAWDSYEKLAKYSDFEIPGLSDLARKESVVLPIPYIDRTPSPKKGETALDFKNLIAETFNKGPNNRPEVIFKELHRSLSDELGGCPSNILPISTVDPDLKGYTEIFTRTRPTTFDELKEKIQEIVIDVEHFMPHLSPAKCII